MNQLSESHDFATHSGKLIQCMAHVPRMLKSDRAFEVCHLLKNNVLMSSPNYMSHFKTGILLLF